MKQTIKHLSLFFLVLWPLHFAGAATVLWTYDIGQRIVTSPAVANDGTIYVGSTAGLFAITNAGAVASNRWVFGAGFAPDFSGSPAIETDGTIYFVGGLSNSLFAVNPDGTQRWTLFGGGGGGTPAIAWDKTLYFQAYTGLCAVASSGAMKWCLPVGESGNFTPAVLGQSGTIYFLSQEAGRLYAIDPSGVRRWSNELIGSPAGLPAIGDGGTIYASEGTLYAFRADGTNLWTLNAQPGLDGPPIVDRSGNIYVAASGTHTLYAVAPSGELLWQALSSSSKWCQARRRL